MSLLSSMLRFETPVDQPPAASAYVDPSPSQLSQSSHGQRSASILPLASLKSATAPISSRFSPWLLALAYPLGCRALMPFYFRDIEVAGQDNVPRSGPVILAPTHRSRWDALVIPYVAGYYASGRHLRYMVTQDEVVGLQGWLIRRLGGFPINTRQPAIASLRHGMDLLEQGEMLVIFPEGDIFRSDEVQPLKPGLARLAVQAEMSQPHLGVQVLPISLHYSDPTVPWRCRVKVCIGAPLAVADFCAGASKANAKELTAQLQTDLQHLAQRCLS